MFLNVQAPSEEFARSVLDRTFSFTPYAGNPKADIDIKETISHQGDPDRLRLYNKIMGIRKLLLVYRRIHFEVYYDDKIPTMYSDTEQARHILIHHRIEEDGWVVLRTIFTKK